MLAVLLSLGNVNHFKDALGLGLTNKCWICNSRDCYECTVEQGSNFSKKGQKVSYIRFRASFTNA